MGACKSCSRVVLVLINVLFSVIGLAMLIVGSIVRWGTAVMDQYLADVYKAFSKALEDHVDLKEFDIADLLSEVTLSFIVVGAFFFVIGILGCIGACCSVKPMLILYIVILTIIVLAEVAFVVVLFVAKDQVDKWLKKPFQSVIKDYNGINGTDAGTLGLNFLMTQLKCCGIDNYTDFYGTKWNRTHPDGFQKALPAVCCKNTTDDECLETPTSDNSYYDTGCYSKLKEWLNDNLEPLIGTSAGVLVIEVILVIFACVACVRDKKGDDDDDDDYDKPVMDDRQYDAIRAYDQRPPPPGNYGYGDQGYHGPHHNRGPYRGGPHENRAYQNDYPGGRRDRRY